MNVKGLFITFEGCEGSGKSTQSARFCRYLKENGLSVVHIREPGGTKIGEQIRRILLSPRNKMTPLCETLLYMAARAELVRTVIKPALARNKIVVCDRFLDSTRAYQGYGLGVDTGLIERVGMSATERIIPDLTIFLDLPVKKGLMRSGRTKDRIENRPILYHRRVREGFLKLSKRFPRRVKVIKVAEDKNKTQKRIRDSAKEFLKKNYPQLCRLDG